MVFKFVVIAGLLAVVSAGILPTIHHGGHVGHAIAAAPILIAKSNGNDDGHDQHAEANYEFSYSVHDGHTGDIKSQHESRHGNSVKGQYSLVEPDGHRRTVEYEADEHNGFTANVHREGPSHHVQSHQPSHKLVAPIAITHHSAPVTYSHKFAAPVAIAHHAAPITIAHHAIPLHHTATITHHAGPVTYAHVAPVAIAHATPVVHHAAPIAIAHSAPATSHSSISIHHDSDHSDHNDSHH